MELKYYVAIKPQTNGHHAIHRDGCPFLPDKNNRICLGNFKSGIDALVEGLKHFYRTKSCLFCIKEPHPDIKKTQKFSVTGSDKLESLIASRLTQDDPLLCCSN